MLILVFDDPVYNGFDPIVFIFRINFFYAVIFLSIGILDYFTEVYSGTQVKSPKPAPDIFLLCLGDYAKEESFIFEDSHNGARAGIASGIDTIIVEDVALITAEDRKEAFAVIKQLDEAIKFI